MMFQCTADQWADFVCDYRTYQTEEILGHGISLMHSWLKFDKVRIASVRYEPDGNRMYYIDKTAASDAEARNPQHRMFPKS